MDLFRCAALSLLSLMGYSHQSGSVPISEANSCADHVSCASEETCDIAADGRAVRRIMVSRMRSSTLRYVAACHARAEVAPTGSDDKESGLLFRVRRHPVRKDSAEEQAQYSGRH